MARRLTFPHRDPATQSRTVAVYYDGACPLCSREIAFYRRLDRAGNVDWIDISACASGALPDGLTRDAAKARFHVRSAEGTLVSGAAAFVALWKELPRFRLAGRLLSGRMTVRLLDRLYDVFLTFRPRLQRLTKGRRRAAENGA